MSFLSELERQKAMDRVMWSAVALALAGACIHPLFYVLALAVNLYGIAAFIWHYVAPLIRKGG